MLHFVQCGITFATARSNYDRKAKSQIQGLFSHVSIVSSRSFRALAHRDGRHFEALGEELRNAVMPVKDRRLRAGLRGMAGKSFFALVLASMLAPAVGVGLFVLLNAF